MVSVYPVTLEREWPALLTLAQCELQQRCVDNLSPNEALFALLRVCVCVCVHRTNMQRVLQAVRPALYVEEPDSEWRRPFFRLISWRWFDPLVMVVILMNTVSLAMEHEGENATYVGHQCSQKPAAALCLLVPTSVGVWGCVYDCRPRLPVVTADLTCTARPLRVLALHPLLCWHVHPS